MTDNQVLRKKITQSCISSLEERTWKGRLTQEEIQNIIVSEVVKVIKDEY
jgi:hypothetical protein